MVDGIVPMESLGCSAGVDAEDDGVVDLGVGRGILDFGADLREVSRLSFGIDGWEYSRCWVWVLRSSLLVRLSGNARLLSARSDFPRC